MIYFLGGGRMLGTLNVYHFTLTLVVMCEFLYSLELMCIRDRVVFVRATRSRRLSSSCCLKSL